MTDSNNNRTNTATTTFNPIRQHGTRILAKGAEVSNDTWTTGLNNNDLIIGPTGAGKTRYYVKPNLMQGNESVIVTDTKGSLVKEVGPLLAELGYHVACVDFTDTMASYGYNPFDFLCIDEATGKPNEQDILKVAKALCPPQCGDDRFWDEATKNLVGIFIGFIMEALPKQDRNLASVAKMLAHTKVRDNVKEPLGATEQMLDDFARRNPRSFTASKWQGFRPTIEANRTYACLLGMVSERFNCFIFDGALKMFTAQERIDFKQMGQRKTALFLNVSDTDRSLDALVNLLYTQALQELCRFADTHCEGHALPVPVRLYLDDFATNCVIPDFDKIISVIRSRNIAVSVVLQSITQLDALYNHAQSTTIVNGCDHWLYLGGQDIETARTISEKASRALESILNMGVGDIWLFERGSKPRKVERYDLCDHRRYPMLPEAHQADGMAERGEATCRVAGNAAEREAAVDAGRGAADCEMAGGETVGREVKRRNADCEMTGDVASRGAA